MKVLSYEGLQLYHQLASEQFNNADEIGSINDRIDTINSEIDTIDSQIETIDSDIKDIDSEIGTLKSNVKQSDWNQTDENAIDFIKNKPTNFTVDAITNSEIDAICF